MTINTTWTDPSEGGSVDLDTGNTLTDTVWDAVMSNIKNLGGTTGRTAVARREWQKGADISSATATAIGADGNFFDITGTTTITSFSGMAAGMIFWLQFDGAVVLTHHSTNIKLPGGANITTAAGDIAVFHAEGATTSRCISYTKASGEAVVAAGGGKIQQVGFSSAFSGNTTSSSYADITNGNVSLDVTKGGLIAAWHLAGYNSSISTNNYFALQLASESEVGQVRFTQPIANQDQTMAGIYVWTSVSTATQRVDLRMKTSGGTLTLREGHLMLQEFDD